MSFSFFFSSDAKVTVASKQSSLTPANSIDRPATGEDLAKPSTHGLLAPISASVLKDEGNVLAEQGYFVKAMHKWDEALQCEPDNPILYELKSQALMEMGEYELAQEQAALAVQFGAHWSDAHLTLGRVYFNLGQLEKARQCMERALALANVQSDVHGRPYGQNASAMEITAELDEVVALLELQQQMDEAKNATAHAPALAAANDASEAAEH